MLSWDYDLPLQLSYYHFLENIRLTFLLVTKKKKKKKKGNQPIKNSRHRSIPPPLGKEREKSRGTCYAEREDVRQGGNQRNHAREASWTTEGWRGQVLGRRADSTRGEIGPRIMAV